MNFLCLFSHNSHIFFKVPKNKNIPNTPSRCLNLSFSLRFFSILIIGDDKRENTGEWRHCRLSSQNYNKISNHKQETLRVVIIATICSTLLHFANFNIFGGLYIPVQHLWWSFYCEKNKPLIIFTKSSIVDIC